MADELNIVVLCGSLRRGSLNLAVAKTLPSLAPKDMKLTLLEGLSDFPLYNADTQSEGFPQIVLDWAEAIRAADGVIFVSPEYNFSVPGVLKNAIDWLSRLRPNPFSGKPVALQSAAPGMLGGARMQYHMRQIMVFLDAVTMNEPEVFVANARDKVSNEGLLTDDTSRGFIADQLIAFEAHIRKHG